MARPLPTDSIPGILGKSGFFGRGSSEFIESVSRLAKMESYSKGDLVFAEGTPCTGMYVVASGAIKVYKIGPDGREHVLHVAEPVETFGEAAMFLGAQGYPAYAGAVKISTVVFVPKRRLLELLEREPKFCFEILGSLATWTHRLVMKVELLTLKDASSRLAGYFINRAKDAGSADELDLSIPKSTLAAQLAISSETFSRLLNRFEAQGLIEVDGRHISIIDQDGLQEVADWGAGES